MNLKDLHGKIGRFFRGRIRAFGTHDAYRIPTSCIHHYPVEGKLVVLFYSGDGGWANLTTTVSKHLQHVGISVHGIDCMHYFWDEKTPEQAARNLEQLITETCLPEQSLILMGYSMGADVLPSIAVRLPEKILHRVDHIILMSATHRAELKFRFIGWLGFATPAHLGHPLLPDLKSLSHISITCLAGEKENDSILSEDLTGIAATLRLPGGHHYASDYDRLSKEILSIIDT